MSRHLFTPLKNKHYYYLVSLSLVENKAVLLRAPPTGLKNFPDKQSFSVALLFRVCVFYTLNC